MRHPEFPIVSFLCLPLLVSSIPSHIRAGSVATIALITWMTVLNLVRGVNSIVWANNVVIRLEVWCDITTKLLIGFSFAVPLSMLCICRHLENVSSNRQALITREDKRRRMKFETFMCFVIPVIFMVLHYVVQGHRFDLIEDIGCYPNTYVSVAGVLLIWVPPLIISLVTFVYAVAAFHHFLQRRIEFAALLQSSNSALSPGRYFRLMALAIVEIMWDSGTNIYILYFNTFTGLRPWISWENVHSNFSRVDQYPEFLIPPSFITQTIVQWWIIPVSSISIFLFFGFGEEAMGDYRSGISWFRSIVLRQHVKPRLAGARSVLPAHRGRTHNVDIMLPATSEAASEHDMKSWDEMSLKMPEITQHFGGTIPENHTTMRLEHARSFSLADSRRSSSTASSTSSSFTPAVHSIPPLSSIAPVGGTPTATPAVTVTSPESNFSSLGVADCGVSFPSPIPHSAPSFEISRPASYRRSTSSDLGITVSQAYHPDTETASRCHEEVFLTPAAFNDAPPRPADTDTYPLGGIRMTVEKTVV